MNIKNLLLLTFAYILLSSSLVAGAPTNNSSTAAIQDNQNQPQQNATTSNSEPLIKNIDNPKLQAKLNVKVDGISEEEYQKIVSEYKNYLKTVSPKLRKEVIEYRKEIAKINKQKIELYRKLSQEAQQFLAKENAIKKKLPINNKKQFVNEIRQSESE